MTTRGWKRAARFLVGSSFGFLVLVNLLVTLVPDSEPAGPDAAPEPVAVARAAPEPVLGDPCPAPERFA